MKLKLILDFIGTLIPVLFPQNEFQPKRFAAVVIMLILIAGGVHFFGVDVVSSIIDLSDDALDLAQ